MHDLHHAVDYRSFWGKARSTAETGVDHHPLVAHSLDVAAVSLLLPRHGLEIDGRTLACLVGLHDIGKFSRPFQSKSPLHWPTGSLGPLAGAAPPPGPRHDALGLHILQEVVGDLLEDGLLPDDGEDVLGWLHADRARIMRALAGHHGRPVSAPAVDRRVFCPGCRTAARDFTAAMLAVFRPPPLHVADAGALARLEWRLAGLTTLADWVGSRRAWFPYAAAEAVEDPDRYFWTFAMPRAATALAAAGLVPSRPGTFAGVRSLFPAIVRPSPAQAWAEGAPLPDGPVLAVIEDVTGSGKTEAALVLAHRLLASGRADGLFVALPTMATANAMFDRLADAYRGLFEAGSMPSLALVHGRAALDPRFRPAMAAEPRTAEGPMPADPADETAESHCSAWLAEDRRRGLLAQVGVGTIDQALMAVLPVRHATLRLHGLAGKVLVIDEAHAFDAYMHRELIELLRFHAALGGSAILLSATLARATRQRLVDAFRGGLGAKPRALASDAYPLATLSGSAATVETHFAMRDGLAREVAIERIEDAAAAALRIVAAPPGSAIAWIRNTVDDALEAAAMLRAAGLEPIVFHARFALCDRLDVEAEVLRRFGPRGTSEARCGVLVATQVIEQSLDLDFDLVCTDLAPADRLIQRAGRLHRHARGPRAAGGPRLLVVSPEPVDAPDADWIRARLPGTAAVYPDPALLWRTARALFRRGSLRTPEDLRPVIEEVAHGEIPDALAAQSGTAHGRDVAAGGIAAQNVLRFTDGYRPDKGAWEPDTRTPTRLEDQPQVTLRLALLRDGRIVPYAAVQGDVRRAWSLSEVSVARRRLASCPLPPALAPAAEAARGEWGSWERESEDVVLALLVPDGDDGHGIEGRTGEDSPCRVRYTAGGGLTWVAA